MVNDYNEKSEEKCQLETIWLKNSSKLSLMMTLNGFELKYQL